MSRSAKSHRLIRALRQLAPDAIVSVIAERPWHSVTFSGVRICLSMRFSAEDPADYIAQFKCDLSEMEFDLSGQFVADIEVTDETSRENQVYLTIDALLLDV